jgi:uncharacterized protein
MRRFPGKNITTFRETHPPDLRVLKFRFSLCSIRSISAQERDAMVIPDEKTCMALMAKHLTPDHIVRHCLQVWCVAGVIGRSMTQREPALDMDLLRAACLLHDIGKYPCILEGGRYHDRKGKEMLESEGYPEVAEIVARHVILAERDNEPIGEAHILFYADKRVNHDEIVSLEERFDYLFKTYANTPNATARLNEMKTDTMRLEERIFQLVDFSADSIVMAIESGG